MVFYLFRYGLHNEAVWDRSILLCMCIDPVKIVCCLSVCLYLLASQWLVVCASSPFTWLEKLMELCFFVGALLFFAVPGTRVPTSSTVLKLSSWNWMWGNSVVLCTIDLYSKSNYDAYEEFGNQSISPPVWTWRHNFRNFSPIRLAVT